MSDRESRIVRLVATALDTSESSLSLDSTPEQVETWDSLTHLQIMMQVEHEFGVRVDMEAAAELSSIREILNYVDGLAGSSA